MIRETTPLLLTSSNNDVENQHSGNNNTTTNTRALSAITETISGETEHGNSDSTGRQEADGRPLLQQVVADSTDTNNYMAHTSQRSLYESSYVHTRKQIQNLSLRTEKLKKAKSLNSTSFRKLLQSQQQQSQQTDTDLLYDAGGSYTSPPVLVSTNSVGYGSVMSKSSTISGGTSEPVGPKTHQQQQQQQQTRTKILQVNQMLSASSINTSIRSTESMLPSILNRSTHDEGNNNNNNNNSGSKKSVHSQVKVDNNDNNAEDVDEKITTGEVLIDIFFGKGIVSLCLLAIPFAIASNYIGWSATSVFWLNFVVMIPLASILGDFTEEVAIHTNETIGGLINASFGNAVEIIVAIQALLANEIRVVQASMLGSIFSNLLLVLGCCFFFGGLYHKEQTFNATAASANIGLLALSSIALVLPTPFADYYNLQDDKVLLVSRVSALFLIFIYIQLLIFQLKTHAYLFDGPDDYDDTDAVDDNTEKDDDKSNDDDDSDGHKRAAEPSMTLFQACFGLFSITCMVALFSEFLVGSIEGFTASSGISRTFVGVVLLPIVGNAVEHITAVTVAIKDKMDLAMGISLGSCTQISLFVAPLSVLLGWALDKNMTLNFPLYEVALYALSIFTVSVVCSNPRCNWLEGSVLVTTYALLALGFWFEVVQDEV